MNPGYYAIITAEVRYDKRLCANAKLLYGEITALCNKEGFCWAKNDYFANLYEVNDRTIRRWIKQLQDFDYLIVTLNKTDNKRAISLGQKCPDLRTKMSRPADKNVHPSIYSINNTINTTGSAINFLITNYQSALEQEFLMHYQKQFKNEAQFNEFIQDFNDEAIKESKAFDYWLIGMLRKYARNWLKFKKNQGLRVIKDDVNSLPKFKKLG